MRRILPLCVIIALLGVLGSSVSVFPTSQASEDDIGVFPNLEALCAYVDAALPPDPNFVPPSAPSRDPNPGRNPLPPANAGARWDHATLETIQAYCINIR